MESQQIAAVTEDFPGAYVKCVYLRVFEGYDGLHLLWLTEG
jgi:hypothetical protein